MRKAELIRRIRMWLSVFMGGLVLSGITAFPLESELSTLLSVFTSLGLPPGSEVFIWLRTVHDALVATNRQYPFLAYGTEWLAFAHLVIALAFLGPWRDPVRNQWLLTFGLIACVSVAPLALIAGEVRRIPLYWRLIDCSFGVFGVIPLLICRRYVAQIQRLDS